MFGKLVLSSDCCKLMTGPFPRDFPTDTPSCYRFDIHHEVLTNVVTMLRGLNTSNSGRELNDIFLKYQASLGHFVIVTENELILSA